MKEKHQNLMLLIEISDNEWTVKSTSGGIYTVKYCGSGDGDPEFMALWNCSCRANSECKHILAVSNLSWHIADCDSFESIETSADNWYEFQLRPETLQRFSHEALV